MKSAHHLISQPLLRVRLHDGVPGGNRRTGNPIGKLRFVVAVSLLLLFVAFRTAFLPVAAVLAAGFSDDHAVRLVAADGHWDLVLSHHDQAAHAAELLENIQHDHQHGWAAGLLVTLAESPVPDGDHVIHFSFSDQVSTEHSTIALRVATPSDTLYTPTVQLATVPILRTVTPLAAARPPPVSQLLLSLRTIVLVV